jgi:8-oxo-dGTP pyrophosphatase MutT (NUDIX family)
MTTDPGSDPDEELPRAIPVSAGALIFDAAGRLLILKPTYKTGWTIPGGVMEPTGESPWQACQREVREECGLAVTSGRLVAVDTRPWGPYRPSKLRLLFDCGVLDDAALAGITLCSTEISHHLLVPPLEALLLLRPPIGRRVAAALAAAPQCVYLEDGTPVPGIG